jgi:hypothetical protein
MGQGDVTEVDHERGRRDRDPTDRTVLREIDMAIHYLFDVKTPLGFRVHCTEAYWTEKIISAHPIMAERIEAVKLALANPAEVRLSRIDTSVYLFYTSDEKRLVCAVARSINGDGFRITAYPTDKMKTGETVWTK